ncbi:hypothetical protein [Streptomyces sp. NPDC005485]|uniref:hypothetical protein n=1 Tax=Streptomyces sp. NPDC005485 TaxID=3155591 RepID=UPI0033B13C02
MATFNQTGQTVGNQVNAETVTVKDFGGTGVVQGGGSGDAALREVFAELLDAVGKLHREKGIDDETYAGAVGVLGEAQRAEAAEAGDPAAEQVKKRRLTVLVERLSAALAGVSALAPLIGQAEGLVRALFGGQA